MLYCQIQTERLCAVFLCFCHWPQVGTVGLEWGIQGLRPHVGPAASTAHQGYFSHWLCQMSFYQKPMLSPRCGTFPWGTQQPLVASNFCPFRFRKRSELILTEWTRILDMGFCFQAACPQPASLLKDLQRVWSAHTEGPHSITKDQGICLTAKEVLQWMQNRSTDFVTCRPTQAAGLLGPLMAFLKRSWGTGCLRRQSARAALLPAGEPRGRSRSGQTHSTPHDLPGDSVLPVLSTLGSIMV